MVFSVKDNRYTLRYDALGMEEQVNHEEMLSILQVSGCHEGGHLLVGKRVLHVFKNDTDTWEGKIVHFCPGRLKRPMYAKPAKKRSKYKKKQKHATRLNKRLLDITHVDSQYFWRVQFEDQEDQEICLEVRLNDLFDF